MKVSGLKYLAKQGVENIWKNRMMSFASFCVLLVSLLLVGVATLFYMNISSMMGGIENKNEIIVYLDENTTQEEVSVLKGQLSQIDNIAEVNFYSKEESFEDLKNSMDGYEMLFDSLGDDNPLVDAYRLRVKNIDQIADTIVQIESLDHIYSITSTDGFRQSVDGTAANHYHCMQRDYCCIDCNFAGHHCEYHKSKCICKTFRDSDYEICWCDQCIHSDSFFRRRHGDRIFGWLCGVCHHVGQL